MGLMTDLFDDQPEDSKEEPSSLLDIFDDEDKAEPVPQAKTTPIPEPAPDIPEPVSQVIPEPNTAKEAMDLSKDELIDQEIKNFYSQTGSDARGPFLGGTAGMFQATSPDFMEVAGQETLQQFKGAKMAYTVANNGMEIGNIGSRIMNGNETEKDLTRLAELQASNQSIMKEMDDDVTIAEAFATFAPYLVQSAVEGGKGALQGALVGATVAGVLGNFIPGGLAAPEEVLTIPAGFALGAKIGGSYMSADAIARVEQGSAFLNMIDEGVDVDIARSTARVIGNVNGALELVQLGALGKALPKGLVRKATQTASVGFMKNPAAHSLLKRIGAMGTEVAAEDLQELVTMYGESVGKALDEDPSFQGYIEGVADVSGKEVWDTVVKTTELTGKGLLPLFLPGMAVDVANVAAGQKTEAAAQAKPDQTIAPQDLKTNTTAVSPENDFKVEVVGPGKLVIRATEDEANTTAALEFEGTPASQEESRVGDLLGDDKPSSHISVQSRNLGGQTENQDRAAKSQGDAHTNISDETRGQMGIELHSKDAEAAIMNDEKLEFEIQQAFEGSDYNLAREISAEQVANSDAITTSYTEIVKAQDTKAKGQKVIPNPKIQEALTRDGDHRVNRAKENQRIAQNNVIKQQQQQNQDFINQLDNPELHRGILFNEVTAQKNRGNPEGSKLYDRALKETAKRENMGDLDYLDSLNVSKLSDLKTDFETYGAGLTAGSREWHLINKTIGSLTEQISEKREWEIKKGRDEQGDTRAREAEKAKKDAAAKAKKTTGETKLQKTVRRARTGAAKPAGAKDVAGKGVTPATKKKQSKLADRVAAQKKREAAVQKQQTEVRKAEQAKTRARIERAKSAERKAQDVKDAQEHQSKIDKQLAQNKDLFQGSEIPQVGRSLTTKGGTSIKLDAFGEDGTTTPAGMVSMTIQDGPAKGATVNVSLKNFDEALTAKINEAEAQRAPEGSVNISALKDTSKQFGIITAENPAGKAQSGAKNKVANQRLANELKAKGLKVVQVEGQFGSLEKPFIVEGIDQKTLTALGQNYGQESVIHLEGSKAVYLEGSTAVDTVNRSDIRKSPEADDFYTKLPDGTKFQIPFFEEIQEAQDNGIILDLTNLRAQGEDFMSLLDRFTRHIKHGKRSWLHGLAKKAGVPYFFITGGEAGLAKNEQINKIPMKERETIIKGFNGNLGIFVGSGTAVKGIFVNVDALLNNTTNVSKALEVIDHEALHAVVNDKFGKMGAKARTAVRRALQNFWQSIPEDSKAPVFKIMEDGWQYGGLFIKKDAAGKGELLVQDIITGVNQIQRGGVEEIVTYAFTNEGFAHWLQAMPSQITEKQGIKPMLKTMFNKLQEIITNKILGQRSKLDDVTNIMNTIMHREKIDVRFSKAQVQAGAMTKTKVNVALAPIKAKLPNAAKTVVVQSETELPADMQLSPEAKEEGIVIESVYNRKDDTVYVIADNIKDEAHLLKKFMHENVAHKGLRAIFPNKVNLEKFLGEARSVLFKAGLGKDIDNVSMLYHGTGWATSTKKQKMETVEEYLALNYAEKLDLKTRNGLLKKLMDMLKRWLPVRFLDQKVAGVGSVLTLDDLNTVMEAAKHKIMNKQPKLTKAIADSFTIREPRVPSSISDVKFQRTVKGYVKAVKEVMAELPEAKQWYPAHLQRLEKVFGRDGLLFNLLLSITSPNAKVVENVGHAVDTYLYMLGYKDKPGGLYWTSVQKKVDAWRSESDVLAGIGKQFKINEFVRGLLGDKNATVVDVWMVRALFGLDTNAVPSTAQNQAARQMLFDVAKGLEQDTGAQWGARDVQAVLWTWIKAKQDGTSFADVPNFETGFTAPRTTYNGRTALEELHKYISPEDVIAGPLSDQLGMTGFTPTPISRMEKSRMMQMARVPHLAKMKKPVDGKYENEDGTAGFTIEEGGLISDVHADVDIPGIYTEMLVQAIAKGGRWTMAPMDYADAYEHAGFVIDLEDRNPGDLIRIHVPEYVIDSYRNKNGKVTVSNVRSHLGGTVLDLEPRTTHRYSLAKIEYSDSAAHDEAGMIGPDGQPNFLNRLFEWKDQADLNIQRAINKMEQDFLEKFGGRKLSKAIPGTTGLLSNNAKTRLLQKAMNLYIDSGPATNNFKKAKAYAAELAGKKKLTNIEKDRLGIINRMVDMSEEEMAWADSQIRPWFDEMYTYAKDRDIIDTYVESYVSRAWKVPKGHDVVGAANTEQTSGSFSNFKITTPHAKQRQFSSIIDGWKEGTDWTLKNDAVITNLHTYMDQINEVASNLRFINYMKEMVDVDGVSLIREDIDTDKQGREEGYVQLHARGFSKPFQKVWARKDIAGAINKVTESGVSSMWSIPGILGIQKINAMVKGSILSLSAFHHLAGVRSWEFGVKKGLKLNAVKAYRDGLDKIEQLTETNPGGYKLGATADFLIKHGLTIGRIQDWDQSVLAGEKSLIEGILSNRKSKISMSLLNLKRTARHGREMWTRSLFGRLFAGLKVEAASMELAHNIKVAEKQKGEALTSAELAEIGRRTSRLINADFGGLHLRRMGRNMDLQKIAQLLLLAPDWTESNFRTVTGMMGMNKWINKMITDFPAPTGMQKTYAKFWFGIGIRLMVGYGLAVAATMAVGDEEDREKYADLLKHSFTSWEGFKKAKWTGIPLDPWLNRIPGYEKDTEWSGFRLGGHFFDILKVMELDKLVKHKVSPMIRTIETLATGTDWKGAPIVGIEEMIKTGKIVSDNPFERERNLWSRLVPTAAYEVRAAMPIFMQEGLRQLQGEAMLSEFGRAAGVDIRPLRIPNLVLDEYTEINSEMNAIARDIKDAKATKNLEARREAYKRRDEFKYGYNKTKSRLGFAKKRLSIVKGKIKVLNLKVKQGKELDVEDQQKLKDLEAQKQRIMERFLEVMKGNSK